MEASSVSSSKTEFVTRREWVPIEELVMDPFQSREEGWSGSVADRQLVSSIEAIGLLQDLVVRPLESLDIATEDTDASYTIVAGSRRYQAATEAGMEEVPCKIIDTDDLEAAWASLVENTDRKALSEHEVANQLRMIYDLIRPLEEPDECPECGTLVDGETGLTSHWGQTECNPPAVESRDISLGATSTRFASDRQARRYIAWRYLGRTDDSAVDRVNGHLETADLPPLLQSLFKDPEERSTQEKTALENYGISATDTLGSGEGRSKASQVVSSVYNTVAEEFDADEVNPTDAVLEVVGELRTEDGSEKEFEKSIRRFRRELAREVEEMEATDNRQARFQEVLKTHAEGLREAHKKLDRARPFKRVDVRSPETERYSRWYALAHAQRDVRSHGDLIRELYQERLESLADEQGWE